MSSQNAGPVFHNVEPETGASLLPGKPFSVILHHDSNHISFALKAQDDFARAGVFNGIPDSLLRNPVKVERNSFVSNPDGLRQLELTMDTLMHISLRAECAQSVGQSP